LSGKATIPQIKAKKLRGRYHGTISVAEPEPDPRNRNPDPGGQFIGTDPYGMPNEKKYVVIYSYLLLGTGSK
jgi:hypothetical protein